MSAIRAIPAAIALLAFLATASPAGAQDPPAPKGPDPMEFLDHVTNAGSLAADDLKPSLVDCVVPPANAAASVTKVIDAPPTKVFDQLYYLGMNSVASWAIVTSAGIIHIQIVPTIPKKRNASSWVATRSWASTRRR